MSVPAIIAPTIGKLIPRLASEHDGEIVATAKAIERVLKSCGFDWHDLAAAVSQPATQPSSDWRRTACYCAGQASRLSNRELDFIASLAQWRGEPTEKQQKWLRDIAERLRRAT